MKVLTWYALTDLCTRSPWEVRRFAQRRHQKSRQDLLFMYDEDFDVTLKRIYLSDCNVRDLARKQRINDFTALLVDLIDGC